MFKKHFGTKNQISFKAESDYYLFLGYLAKNDGSTKIVWETNKKSGAFEDEGRIQFFVDPPKNITAKLTLTAGVGKILHRVNCNEFTENIVENHNFRYGEKQHAGKIKTTIPDKYIIDFGKGLKL